LAASQAHSVVVRLPRNPVCPRGLFLAVIALVSAAAHCQSEGDWLIAPGERVGPITAETSETSLGALFGPAQVRHIDVQLGEGTTTPGTAIYPDDADRRIEIVWTDSTHTRVREIRLAGNSSTWRTAEGISLGSTLKDIERLNGFPFRLTGFGWDYAGTIIGCGRGRLTMLGCSGSARADSEHTPRHRSVIVRLAPDSSAQWRPESRQVTGDREFSSGHPAMQSLNPRVYQMIVSFDPPN
jgi:hypothetical protein